MRTITIPLNYCFYCFLFFLSASNVEGISMLDFINKSNHSFSHQNFVEKRWDNNSGLPVNSLAHITLSDEGYLWIASFDGLIKYNGSTFSTISIESHPNLKSNRFIRVYQQANGHIVTLTQNGDVYLYNPINDIIKQIPFPKSSKQLHVENIFKTSNGRIYASTNKGLWLVSNSDSLVQVNEPNINEATFGVVEDQFSTLWVQKGYSSLFRITDHSFQVIQAVPQHNLKVLDAYNSKTKSFVASNRLLAISDSAEFKVLHFDKELNKTQLTSVFVTKNEEKVLLGSYNNGFYLYDLQNKSFEPNTILGNAFPKNHFNHSEFGELLVTTNSIYDSNLNLLYHDPFLNIISALPDLEGGIWLATDGNGLIRLSKNRFFTYKLQHDLNAKSNNILSVLEDESGKLWFGSYGDGVYTLTNDEIKRFSLGDGKHGLFNHSMYQSKTQGIFVASVSNGIYQIIDNSVIKSTLPVSETLNINSAFEDYNHNILLSTSNGLFLKSSLTPSFDQSEIISISSKTNYKFVFEAPDSSLWVSVTQDGSIN